MRWTGLARKYFYSYLLTITLSLLLSILVPDHLWIQELVGALWAVFVLSTSVKAMTRGESAIQLLRAGLFSQLPGIFIGTISLVTTMLNHPWEWAEGLLELWTYPFLSLEENIKSTASSAFSTTFLLSCLVPAVLACIPLFGSFITVVRAKIFGYETSVWEKH